MATNTETDKAPAERSGQGGWIVLLVLGLLWLYSRRAEAAPAPEAEPGALAAPPAWDSYRAYLAGILDYSDYLDDYQGTLGLSMSQARPRARIAYPEVRSWTTMGPNPALPGTLIRIRQQDQGPCRRDVLV